MQLNISPKPVTILMLLVLSSCGPSADSSKYDAFYRHRLTMQADKSQYQVGDNITLIASVIPKQAESIRLYKNRTKSFRLSLRARTEQDIDFNDNDFHGPLNPATATDEISTVSISPTQPYQLTIKGKVKPHQKGGITFDFGEFGTFNKSKARKFNVSGYWRPISPDPIDSLEDFTNSIQMVVN